MIIVSARHDDIDELIEIQTECKLSPWTARGYEEEMERDDSVMLVARDSESEIAGFIVGRVPVGSEGSDSGAEIYNIGTRRGFRRRGIGSRLIERFIKTSRDRDVRNVWLEVRAGNRGAISFYASFNFEPVTTRAGFYSRPDEDAMVMVLNLGENKDLKDA